LFLEELKDIYDAERQIVKALTELSKAAHSSTLKEALQHHLKETKQHVERLDEISLLLNEDLSGHSNAVVKELLKKGQKVAKSSLPGSIKDAAIINAAQHVEHYEIASYGSLKAFAKHLKMTDVFNLLEDNSKEEGNADKTLTSIAEGNLFQKGVNDKACEKCA
jgi:ferritin-like metal-binding protein YciE